jgi:hypothetical protein
MPPDPGAVSPFTVDGLNPILGWTAFRAVFDNSSFNVQWGTMPIRRRVGVFLLFFAALGVTREAGAADTPAHLYWVVTGQSGWGVDGPPVWPAADPRFEVWDDQAKTWIVAEQGTGPFLNINNQGVETPYNYAAYILGQAVVKSRNVNLRVFLRRNGNQNLGKWLFSPDCDENLHPHMHPNTNYDSYWFGRGSQQNPSVMEQIEDAEDSAGFDRAWVSMTWMWQGESDSDLDIKPGNALNDSVYAQYMDLFTAMVFSSLENNECVVFTELMQGSRRHHRSDVIVNYQSPNQGTMPIKVVRTAEGPAQTYDWTALGLGPLPADYQGPMGKPTRNRDNLHLDAEGLRLMGLRMADVGADWITVSVNNHQYPQCE